MDISSTPAPIRYGDVADLYDVFAQAAFDIPFYLRQAGKVQGEVLELMSGTGRVSLPLVEAGVRLTCVDRSPEMLEVLRRKLEQRDLTSSIHCMDVTRLDLARRFALALIPFHSFTEILSIDDRRQTLSQIWDHLTENGRLICALHNPPVRLKNVDGLLRLWGSYSLPDGQGRLLMWGAQTYDPNTCIVSGAETLETYSPDGVMQSKRLLEFRFYLMEKSEFEALAKSESFQVAELYGNYDESPYDETASPFMIWVLKKGKK